MKYILPILLSFCFKFSAAQPVSFEKYFGSPQLINYGHGISQSASGSIYFGGYGDDQAGLYSLISFTKLDASGNEIFTRYYGDSLRHFMLMRMISTLDGNFLLVGSRMDHGGQNNPYAIKVDSIGTIIWEHVNTSVPNSWYSGVAEFSNGNLVFSGATTDTINSDLNLSGVITDPFGTILHQFSYGDVGITETSENCVVTPDGTILICGDKVINSSTVNPYIAVFDSTGSYLWDFLISSHHNSGSKNIYLDRNGSLLVIGESATDSSPNFDILLTKIDIPSASMIWSKFITGTNESDAGFAMSETIDGKYAITGYGYDSLTSSKRIFLIVTDTARTEISKKYFGISPINIGYAICPSIYGGFLIAGADFTNDLQVLVYQKELGINVDELMTRELKIYPNPMNEENTIYFSDAIEELNITDLSGRNILSEYFTPRRTNYVLPKLQNGVYIVNSILDKAVFRTLLIIPE